MSFFFQVANALVAGVRTLIDDMSRGFAVGGVAGAIVAVLRKVPAPTVRQALILNRLTLAGIIAYLSFVLLFD